jgi:LmbE family N-acetylglucosaminyl deacetylase
MVIAPHMDDETLGCGMLLAESSSRYSIHVIFATDGSKSPETPHREVQASDPTAASLTAAREAEALQALAILGVPHTHVEFLGFPDGALARHADALRRIVVERARALRPAYVLVPFRYDRHPDHLAVNRAVTAARSAGELAAQVVEYFVYTQWRLLRSGDVRDYLADEDVRRLFAEEAAAGKRAALACYRSQTTRYFEGQRRAILTDALIDRVCREPETFLRHDPARNGRWGLARARRWVPLACRLEPALKRWKDVLLERFVA